MATEKTDKIRGRDIDFAAAAVKKALVEKFGRDNELADLSVEAGETTISVRDGKQNAEGTRDNLLAGIRAAGSYSDVWRLWGRY